MDMTPEEIQQLQKVVTDAADKKAAMFGSRVKFSNDKVTVVQYWGKDFENEGEIQYVRRFSLRDIDPYNTSGDTRDSISLVTKGMRNRISVRDEHSVESKTADCPIFLKKEVVATRVRRAFTKLIKHYRDSNRGEKDTGHTKDTCFIATAVYGSPGHYKVQTLKQFRDRYLLPSPLGANVVKLYYGLSPPLAAFLERHAIARMVTRAIFVSPAVVISALLLKMVKDGTKRGTAESNCQRS